MIHSASPTPGRPLQPSPDAGIGREKQQFFIVFADSLPFFINPNKKRHINHQLIQNDEFSTRNRDIIIFVHIQVLFLMIL